MLQFPLKKWSVTIIPVYPASLQALAISAPVLLPQAQKPQGEAYSPEEIQNQPPGTAAERSPSAPGPTGPRQQTGVFSCQNTLFLWEYFIIATFSLSFNEKDRPPAVFSSLTGSAARWPR